MDAIINRAFRAAVLGLLVLPLQLYSLWLLWDVTFDSAPLSSGNRQRVLLTLIINLPILIFFLVFIWSRFSR